MIICQKVIRPASEKLIKSILTKAGGKSLDAGHAVEFSSAQVEQIATGILAGTVAFPSISPHGSIPAPSFNPMSASRTWNISEAEFPANESPRQKLVFALKYAALAPTQDGWQPWHFRMEETYLELLTKSKPALEELDPDGRELTIGCGAALQYLKVALKHFGCLGPVDLFPDLGNPALVARVHFGGGGERDPQEKLLFAAMTDARPSNSLPDGVPVADTMLAALSHAVAGDRGWLDFVQSEVSLQHVLNVTPPDDGSVVAARPLFDRGFRRTEAWNEAGEPASASDTTLAVVKTKTDDKHGWLAAGQAMARTVMLARALGLSWAFFNPVRSREARAALRMGVGHKGFAQVILRFGSFMTGDAIWPARPALALAAFR